ncbi:hypothetical protein JCM6882_004196 [Rhodosporidiobolus microsporus]
MPSAQQRARLIQARQLARRNVRNDLSAPIEPDVQTDPYAWNSWWEVRFGSEPLVKEADLGNAEKWAFSASDLAVWREACKKRYLCQQIASYSKAVLDSDLGLSISMLWTRTFTPALREALVIQVFKMWAEQGMDTSDRITAPDFKLDRFVRGNGLIDLLDHFVASGQRYPNGDGFDEIISPVFDRLFCIQRDNFERLPRPSRFAQYQVILKRHDYLFRLTTLFVVYTCVMFKFQSPFPADHAPPLPKPLITPADHLGLPRNPYQHAGNSEDVEALRKIVRWAVRTEKECKPWEVDRVKKSWESRGAEICHGCFRAPTQMPEAVGKVFSFNYCPKCDCQMADYSAGHKKVCGKTPSAVFPTPTLHNTTSAPPPPTFGALYQLHQTRRPELVGTIFTISYWVERDLDDPERGKWPDNKRQTRQHLKISSGDAAADQKLREEGLTLVARLAETGESSQNIEDIASLALVCLSDAVPKEPEVRVKKDIVRQFVHDYRVSERALWRALERKSDGRWKEPEKEKEGEEKPVVT